MKKNKSQTGKKSKLKLIIGGVVAIILIASVFGGGEDKEKPEESQTVAETEVESRKPEETSAAPETKEESEPEEQTGNALMDTELKEAETKDGASYAYVNITKEKLKGITLEQFTEFTNTVVKDSGYNWVSVICDDGTGLQYTGSQTMAVDYGKLDSDGCISEHQGVIMITEGGYEYSEDE